MLALTLDEAYERLQHDQISAEDYIHAIFAHWRGESHRHDATRSWESRVRDPVGNALQEIASIGGRGSGGVGGRKGAMDQLEKLCACALQDDADATREILQTLDLPTQQQRRLRQAVASLAASRSAVGVLRLCVEQGASLNERDTNLALEYSTRTPALLDLLFEYDWRDMRESKMMFDRLAAWTLHTNMQELSWFLDHGIKFTRDSIERAAQSATPVKAECLQMILEREGVQIVRGTGLLQDAARRGCDGIATLLLDAGVQVDEILRDTHETTALYEAVTRQHEDTVQLLLDRGASPTKELERTDVNTPLKLAEYRDYARILTQLRQATDRQSTGSRASHSRL